MAAKLKKKVGKYRAETPAQVERELNNIARKILAGDRPKRRR